MFSCTELRSTELLLHKAQVRSALHKESLIEDLIFMAELSVSKANIELAEKLAWQVIDLEQSASRFASVKIVQALLILGGLFELQEKLDFAEQFYRAAVQMLKQLAVNAPDLYIEAESKLAALLKGQDKISAMLDLENNGNTASCSDVRKQADSRGADRQLVMAA